jgi:hypothetical protein
VWQGKKLGVDSAQRSQRPQSWKGVQTKNTGGNADVYQTKGIAEKAIRKTMKTKDRQGRLYAAKLDTHGVAGERRDEAGTLSADLVLETTAFVTICQVRIKRCGLNGLWEACSEFPQRERNLRMEEPNSLEAQGCATPRMFYS